MGIQKMKWTTVEEAALVAGVRKYGTGKWSKILSDAEFRSDLGNRSNIDLKDKWRNLAVSASGERRMPSKTICLAPPPSAVNNLISGSVPALLTTQTQDAKTVTALGDSVKESPKTKSRSKIISMIFDALKDSNSSKGLDVGEIIRYIEERYEAPPNLKKIIGPKLRTLASRGKLSKVDKLYSMKKDSVASVRGPGVNQKQSKSPVTEAAETAADMIADAEKMSLLAKEALNEAKRASKLAEESYSFLEMAKYIYERCSRGEAVYLNLNSDQMRSKATN